jgi:uncharacterized membrane protein
MSVRSLIKKKMRSLAKDANIGLINGARHVTSYGATPNAAITGKVGELCYDTVNDDVYVCTDGATAWTKIFD